MPPLLEEWDRVAERLYGASAIALFLDFDGTISPVVSEPHCARMNRAARLALMRLSRLPQVHAWIISGRRQEDLERRAGAIPGLTCIGLHGAASGSGLSRDTLARLAGARETLASRLNGAKFNGTSGVVIEDKGGTFAVHHRHAGSQETGLARRLLEEIVAERPGLRIVPGDQVWEVMPGEIRGKGDAVRREWRRRSPEALPIYFGNDGTDESAFAALAEGITARVGPARNTRAHYSLLDSAEVARVLELLEDAIRWAPRR